MPSHRTAAGPDDLAALRRYTAKLRTLWVATKPKHLPSLEEALGRKPHVEASCGSGKAEAVLVRFDRR